MTNISSELKAFIGDTGSYDSSVRAWDCRSRTYDPIQVLGDAKDSVTSVQLAPSEILTGCVWATYIQTSPYIVSFSFY